MHGFYPIVRFLNLIHPEPIVLLPSSYEVERDAACQTPLGLDENTLLTIAQLSISDVEDIQARQKGKAKETSPPSDEEVAFKLFADEARGLLLAAQDATVARSLAAALQSDCTLLEELAQAEAGAMYDRQMAVALSEGRPPPYRSEAPAPPVQSSSSAPGLISVAVQRAAPVVASTAAASSDKAKSSTVYFQGHRVDDDKLECVICGDEIKSPSIRAPCGHHYDRSCLVELFQAACRDESLFPPRCCQQPFIVADVQPYLGAELSHAFSKKALEFSTKDRVYCHRPVCSVFLGATTTISSTYSCPRCAAQTCGRCKAPSHPNEPCSATDTADASVLALAEEAGWKRCPGCRRLVELFQGCYHMTCLCGKQFCYVCREPWKNCSCPQWDETLLLVAARGRVERELPRGPAPAPAQFRAMVSRAAEHLRYDHECTHTWRYRAGGGRCENCSHHLRDFLLECRHCRMLACVRCRRNRL